MPFVFNQSLDGYATGAVIDYPLDTVTNYQSYRIWVLSTAYTVGETVVNGGNIYQCITAGTSAASGGPSGTGANITDGTAHWAYVTAANVGSNNNPLNQSGVNGVTKGDLVYLSGGLWRRAGATSVAVNTTGNVKGVGVLEGTEFTGLVAQGQPYSATNVSPTSYLVGNASLWPNGAGKLRLESDSIYEVPVRPFQSQTLGVANVGVAYGLFVDGFGNQFLDTSVSTGSNTILKLVGIRQDDNTKGFVMLATSNTF